MAFVPLILYVGSWVLAWILYAALDASFSEELLRYLLVFSVGVQSLWAFFGHCFHSEEVARHIGWQSGPFQYEVGIANLSFGVLGVLCYFYETFWLPTIIGISIFMLGAAWGHIVDMRRSHNFAPGNAGPIFYTDILIPLTLWGALYFKLS